MCFSCFFSFSWIWRISLLTFVGPKHGHELPVWYFTIGELLDDRDGVPISAFHTALSGKSKAREPQAHFRNDTLTKMLRQSPSPAHI